MMGKRIVLGASVICLALAVAACGDSSKQETANATSKTQATAKTSAVPATAADSSTAAPTQKAAKATKAPEKKKKLTEDEQVALDYFNIYINGSDEDAKAKYVEEKVNEEMKPLYQMMIGVESDESAMMPSPFVKGNIHYTGDGTMDGRAILVSNPEGKEVIIITSGGKFVIPIFPDEETTKEAFDLTRKQFK